MLAILLYSFTTFAQINIGGEPYSWKLNNISEIQIPVFETNRLNMAEITIEDELDEQNGLPPRFGYRNKVDINPQNSGKWTNLPNGDKIWQLEIYCPDARSINFTFDNFWLPENGKLFIYSNDREHKIGAFTNANNKGSKVTKRGFATGLIYRERVIIEYYQPSNQPDANLNINGVVQGYRYIADYLDELQKINKTNDFGDSGLCQVNVNCSPEGNDWQNEKTGVALIIVAGTRLCTGSLINNTCNNGDLLFLTANHCIERSGIDAETNSNADDWSFVWNYESPDCVNPTQEPKLFVTNGAIAIANIKSTDFALLKLVESPLQLDPPIDVMLNGWSRTTTPTKGGVGIHHPSLDVKKIATHDIVPKPQAIDGDPVHLQPQNVWEINWKQTMNGHSVTEGGSSGSPLFTKEGYIIGQLLGGDRTDCSDPSKDEGLYGKLFLSWKIDSNIKRQLANWLDPCNLNPIEQKGVLLRACLLQWFVDFPVNNKRIFQAGLHVVGSSTISNTAEVEMSAGQFIFLNPGFHAQNGSEFYAHIKPCQSVIIPTAKKEQSSNELIETISYNGLNVFPNPTEDIVTINFQEIHSPEIQLIISDITGRRLAEHNYTHTANTMFETILNFSEYVTGTYLITIRNGDFYETKKLFVR